MADHPVTRRPRRSAPTPSVPELELASLADKIKQASDALSTEATDAVVVVLKHEEAALAFCHRLLAVIRVVLNERKDVLPSSGWQVIVVSLITKSMSTVRAGVALAGGGYAREVEIVTRSALEALIVGMFIAKTNSRRRARRWAQYAQFLRARFLKKHGHLSDNPEHKLARTKILAQGRRYKKHFPNPGFWASGLGKGSLRNLAEDVGMLWYYEMVYWLGSQGVHGSAVAVDNYIDVSPDGKPLYKMGLSAEHLHGDLAVCCDILLRALVLLNDTSGLGLKSAADTLIVEYKTAFNGDAVADLVEQPHAKH